MFDQTFLDETQKTSKPVSLFVSTLIQVCVLGILLLIPLVYTATLPGTMFKSLLVAPRPPVVASAQRPLKSVPSRIVRVFSGRSLIAPTSIPKQINPGSNIDPAPDVALVTGSGDAGTNTSSPADFLGSTPGPAPPIDQPKPKPALPRALRVGTGVAEANLISKVVPLYPALAKAARIQGTVEFSATISKEGLIENLQLVRGHPLLVRAARDAVLQWKYRPTLLNAQPVEVLTEIVVNFTLTQ